IDRAERRSTSAKQCPPTLPSVGHDVRHGAVRKSTYCEIRAVHAPLFRSLFQINTCVWLNELSRELGRAATLDDVSDEALDRIATGGFDWIWLLGVWRTGPAGRDVSRSQPAWREE